MNQPQMPNKPASGNNKPVQTIRLGAIKAAIWENTFGENTRYNVSLCRIYKDGDQWKPCYRGDNLGAKLVMKFAPVTAQRVRLNITESTDGPTIWEFALFR